MFFEMDDFSIVVGYILTLINFAYCFHKSTIYVIYQYNFKFL